MKSLTIPTIKNKNDLTKFLNSRIIKSDNNKLISDLEKYGYITNVTGKREPINKS